MVVQEKLCNCLHIYNVIHYTIRLYVFCNILITLCNIYILNIYRVGHGFCLYEQDTSISEYVQAATHTGDPTIFDGHYLEFITKDFNAFLFRHSKERPLGVNSLQ